MKLVLFTPFRAGRAWKLSATAYLCRIGTMYLPFPLVYLAFLPEARRAGGTVAATALVVGVSLFTVLTVVVFYLCSRLQFAFFDMVVNRGEFVAPAWRKYGRSSLAWTGVKMAVGVAVTLGLAVPMTAYFRQMMALAMTLSTLKKGQPPPPEFVAGVFAGYGLFLLCFGGFFLISSLLCDFMVPSLALEGAGVGEAFRRMVELVRREPGQFALYVLIKVGLGFVLYMGMTLVFEIVLFLIVLVLFLVFGIVGFLLHLAGVPMAVLSIVGIFLGVVINLGLSGYGLMLGLGPVLTFLDAYALYFLGGRYPLLGELLERSTPPPPPPYVAVWPPHYSQPPQA